MVTFGSGVASDINIGALGGATANVRIRGANINAERNISATGNITGSYILGNGSQLTGLPATYGNANVSNFLSTGFGSNTISTTGNITAGYFLGNGSQLTGITTTASPGGANTNVQFNDAGSLGGTSGLTFNKTSNALAVTGNGTVGGRLNVTDTTNASGASGGQGAIRTDGGAYIAKDLRVIGNLFCLSPSNANLNTINNINLNTLTVNATDVNSSNVSASFIESTGNIEAVNLIVSGGIEAVDSLLIIGDIDMDGDLIMNGSTGSGSAGANIDYINGGGYARFYGNVSSVTGYLIAGVPGSGGVRYTNTDGTAGQVLATHGNGVTYFTTVSSGGNLAGNMTGNISGVSTYAITGLTALTASGNVTGGNLVTGGGAYITGGINASATIYSGTALSTGGFVTATGNVTGANFNTTGRVSATGNINGGNLIMSGAGTFTGAIQALSVATDTISSPSGDFVTIEGVISTNGGQMSGNLAMNDQSGIVFKEGTSSGTNYVMLRSYPSLSTDTIYLLPSDGSNGQVLTTSGTGNLSWTTVSGGSGSPGGSDTQVQYNNGGAFGGMGNVTYTDTGANIGDLALGNIIFATDNTNTNANIQTFENWIKNANDKIGNSSTANTYTPGRYLFGKGLGGTPGSGGVPGSFGVNIDQDGGMRNSRVVIADRYTQTDTGVRNTALMTYNWVDLSGNIGSANSNTRIQGIVSALAIGGNGSGNLVNNSLLQVRGYNSAINVGTTANANVGNAVVHAVVGYNSFVSVNPGSEIKNQVHYLTGPSAGTGGTAGNSIGLTHNYTSSVVYNKIALVNLQNSSGNLWGQNSTLPTTYLFLDNTDTRSSSLVGPIREYYDRPYTFTTTTGSTNLDWNNGTAQYLKPTGNVTLAFANALTSSNGNLFHTVTLVVEQGTTPYTITLPTANATIKYAGAVSTVGATANAVIMITSTAANINGSTTYLTTVSPEFS